MLYIHDQIPITKTESYVDDSCEALFCLSPPLSLMIICLYNPCNSSLSSFSKSLDFLQKCIGETTNSHKYTIMMIGDFNFLNLWKIDSDEVVRKNSNENKLLEFINVNFLTQYIDSFT